MKIGFVLRSVGQADAMGGDRIQSKTSKRALAGVRAQDELVDGSMF